MCVYGLPIKKRLISDADDSRDLGVGRFEITRGRVSPELGTIIRFVEATFCLGVVLEIAGFVAFTSFETSLTGRGTEVFFIDFFTELLSFLADISGRRLS